MSESGPASPRATEPNMDALTTPRAFNSDSQAFSAARACSRSTLHCCPACGPQSRIHASSTRAAHELNEQHLQGMRTQIFQAPRAGPYPPALRILKVDVLIVPRG